MTTTICYENRNGLVLAYDLETKRVIVPGAEDVLPNRLPIGLHLDPEDYRAELQLRGVKSVLVFTGPHPTWVTGEIPRWLDRAHKFCHMAAQATRHRNVWTEVPVERIADGTDWSDIYHPAP